MENEVRAPCDGVVTGIQAHPGESVAAGATVMRVIPAKQG
jgi:biotin carboxyl carrier protein